MRRNEPMYRKIVVFVFLVAGAHAMKTAEYLNVLGPGERLVFYEYLERGVESRLVFSSDHKVGFEHTAPDGSVVYVSEEQEDTHMYVPDADGLNKYVIANVQPSAQPQIFYSLERNTGETQFANDLHKMEEAESALREMEGFFDTSRGAVHAIRKNFDYIQRMKFASLFGFILQLILVFICHYLAQKKSIDTFKKN